MSCHQCACETLSINTRTCGCECHGTKTYPDCNGLYPHSITKEGCVYCNQNAKLETLINPAVLMDSIDMKACTERMFDLEAGGGHSVVTGLREEQEYQPGPWYCELIYKFYHWCQDWLDGLETWAIAKENKARKKQREQHNK